MSSRPILQPQPVIGTVNGINSGVTGDMSTTITSLVTIVTNISMMSYAYTWAGASPIGVMSVQVSDDYSQNADGSVRNPGTWNDLPLSPTPAVSGSTGHGFVDIDQLGAFAIRTMYTPVSGMGTLTAVYKGKTS